MLLLSNVAGWDCLHHGLILLVQINLVRICVHIVVANLLPARAHHSGRHLHYHWWWNMLLHDLAVEPLG